MSIHFVSKGRWTQEQLDKAVERLHRMVCGSFDGGANRSLPAGKMTETDRIYHEAAIGHVVEALEAAGFKVQP